VATTLLAVAICCPGCWRISSCRSRRCRTSPSGHRGAGEHGGRQSGHHGLDRGRAAGAAPGPIADVSELTSTSFGRLAQIVIQFGLSRDINGAARDVQAAIQAARADLPTTLRNNPTYREYNPADSPIMVLALTSNTLTDARSSTIRPIR
jgi:hypothetical protein